MPTAAGRWRGSLASSRGKVRLLKPEELPADWDPTTDPAALVAKLGSKAGTARGLAYRLYTVCERKKRAAEALAYNGLVQSWSEIVLATDVILVRPPRGTNLVDFRLPGR